MPISPQKRYPLNEVPANVPGHGYPLQSIFFVTYRGIFVISEMVASPQFC